MGEANKEEAKVTEDRARLGKSAPEVNTAMDARASAAPRALADRATEDEAQACCGPEGCEPCGCPPAR